MGSLIFITYFNVFWWLVIHIDPIAAVQLSFNPIFLRLGFGHSDWYVQMLKGFPHTQVALFDVALKKIVSCEPFGILPAFSFDL